MNIIICGAGKVGFSISKQLSAQGHSITVIDQSSELIQKISKIETTASANKENLCWVPFLKKADRIDIPTSSRLVSIILYQKSNLRY